MAQKYNEYYISWEEINKIIAAAKNRKQELILKILAHTGMRRFELRNLKVSDIDFERKRLYIRHGKGSSKNDSRSRSAPIDEATLRDIRFYLDGRRVGFLIQSNKKGSEGISLSQINRIIASCAEKAGISNPNPKLKHLNPHIFRHSFARLALASGVPFNMVQKICGHRDARTTLQMYGVPSVDDTQEVYEDKLVGNFNKKAPENSDVLLTEFDKK